jgi:hypothetical protein
MSAHLHHLSDLNIVYTRAEEPFDLNELVTETDADLQAAAARPHLDMPVLVDFRAVNLVRLPTSGFQDLVRKRLALVDQIGRGPCAYVAGDEGSFGMLRLYTTHCELKGVRQVEDTCVTLDIREAIEWIYARLPSKPSGFSPVAFSERIRQLASAVVE